MVLKNTDESLYLNSEKAKNCSHCGKRYTRKMVYHYKTAHQDSEVFVSRISPEWAQKVKNERISGIKIIKSSAQYLKSFCVFCNREHEFMAHYWPDHIRSHTGEYANECRLCMLRVSFYRHCDMSTKRVEGLDIDLYRNDMVAFICKKCNFVQIDENNMRNHLTKQHELPERDWLKQYYQKFTLLPALNSLAIHTNSNDVSSTGILIIVHLKPGGKLLKIICSLHLIQHDAILVHCHRVVHRRGFKYYNRLYIVRQVSYIHQILDQICFYLNSNENNYKQLESNVGPVRLNIPNTFSRKIELHKSEPILPGK